MHLISIENYKLNIAPEALLIGAFRVLWNRDKTVTKEKAYRELGIIYFQYDPRSNYMFITNAKERLAKILEQEGLPAT